MKRGEPVEKAETKQFDGNYGIPTANPEMMLVNPELLKKAANLPEDAKMLGFIVHLSASDEFLVKSKVLRPGVEVRAFSKNPSLACIYRSVKKARKEAKSYGEKARVAMLLETDKQYIVAEL